MGDCCDETCDRTYSFYPCGANQPYSCEDPKMSPWYFHDGFESGVFDALRWNDHAGDAEWVLEQDEPASEGSYYAEAQTAYIIDDVGTAALELAIDSENGGILSYQIQAFIQAPFEDVEIKVDGEATSIITNAIGNWKEKTLEIEAGHHVIQWILRKNPSNASAEELAGTGQGPPGITRIDNVQFLPH